MDWQKLKEEIQRQGSNYIESRQERSHDRDMVLDDSLAIDVLDYILDVIRELEVEDTNAAGLEFVIDETMKATVEGNEETLGDWLAKVIAAKAYRKG